MEELIPLKIRKKAPSLTLLDKKEALSSLTPENTDRVIEMAWEDRTPFEAILMQFGLAESDVIQVMRKELKRSSFNLWRKRVNQGVSQKHLKKRNPDITRHKCTLQKSITGNKISKR
jgi:uncharacterized protein (TIGR03643 family)